MSIRVTESEVASLVPDLGATSLSSFISTANLVVEESLVGVGLSSARLKEIEKYLAAHYATVSFGEKTSEKIGDSSNSYAKAASGKGFSETALGRQAISLDSSGTLAGLGGDKAEFELL